VPKHVGVKKDLLLYHAVCVISWFSKRNKLIKICGVSNFRILTFVDRGLVTVIKFTL